jgi:hypothetical protein
MVLLQPQRNKKVFLFLSRFVVWKTSAIWMRFNCLQKLILAIDTWPWLKVGQATKTPNSLSSLIYYNPQDIGCRLLQIFKANDLMTRNTRKNWSSKQLHKLNIILAWNRWCCTEHIFRADLHYNAISDLSLSPIDELITHWFSIKRSRGEQRQWTQI